MSDKLEPCPFCGGKAVLQIVSADTEHPTSRFYVACTECHSRGPLVSDFFPSGFGDMPVSQKAIITWNYVPRKNTRKRRAMS